MNVMNVNLDENIYMIKPDDLVTKGQEHMVSKMHKSIYWLK